MARHFNSAATQRGKIHVPCLSFNMFQRGYLCLPCARMVRDYLHFCHEVPLSGQSPFSIVRLSCFSNFIQASQTSIFKNFTLFIVLASSFISLTRVFALWYYYHSPLTVAFEFQTLEIPRLLNVTGLLPVYPPGTAEEDTPRIDLSPIKEFGLKLCYGKDWYRFPGHYLVPNGIDVEFIKSEFDGMLPRHFEQKVPVDNYEDSGVLAKLSDRWWLKPQTRNVPEDLNDLNKEEPTHYVR